MRELVALGRSGEWKGVPREDVTAGIVEKAHKEVSI